MRKSPAKPLSEWLQAQAGQLEGQLLFNEPLAKHTYYRIGGPAEVLAVPKSILDLELLARAAEQTGSQLRFLGAGSNLLVSDDGVPGLVIKTGRLNLDIQFKAPGTLTTGASVGVSTLLRRAAQEGWGGLEFLTGVPGTIGGVVVMNAGTHLGDASERLERVQIFDFGKDSEAGKIIEFNGKDLQFEYRKNLFLPPLALVLEADWRVDLVSKDQVKAVIDENLLRRKATQPVDYPSCGSVFKNPKNTDLRAWQVIEKLKLRGHQVGNAQFSEKHPNFIINLGSARASDVKSLIELAKGRAFTELGIKLEEEVKYF